MGAKTTREIAEFVCNANYEDIPPEVVEYSKSLALSHLGQNIAGSTMDCGRIGIQYVKGKDAQQEAGVFGAGFRTCVDYAALANGNSAHALELEDKSGGVTVYSVGHWPTIFSMGEKLKLPGREVISASIIGYEVASKLNWALVQSAPGKVKSPSACCSIGNAVSASKMLRLNVEQTSSAISLAASQVAGIDRQAGSGAHVVEAGFTGRNGICAAELAALGYTGQPDILEGKLGFGDLWSDCPEFDLALGENYSMMSVPIRKYSCCFAVHINVDAMFELIAKHNIEWSDVASVEHGINYSRSRTLKYDEPATVEETHFSLPNITVACFLDDKKVFLPNFTAAKVSDPRWCEARKKVKVTIDRDGSSDMYKFDSPVTITMKDGKIYQKICHSARGVRSGADDHNYRLGIEHAMKKYLDCVDFAGTYSRARAEQIAELTLGLDKLGDISPLTALLTFPDHVSDK